MAPARQRPEDRVLRRRILVEIFVAGKVDDPLAREHCDEGVNVNLDVTLAARQIKQRASRSTSAI